MGSKKKRTKGAPPASETPLQENDSNLQSGDDDLLDDLLAQIDAKDTAAQKETDSTAQQSQVTDEANDPQAPSRKKDARARFEARKMRKAAEQAAHYRPDDRQADDRIQREIREEEQAINSICDELGLAMHEINPDGHCLYAAIADQLRILGRLPPDMAHFGTTRLAAANYLAGHPDDFLPFLPGIEGEDGAGAVEPGMMGQREFARYCANVRDTAMWGGEPEILALSCAFNVPIHVVQWGNPSIVIHDPAGQSSQAVNDKSVVRISYHRRMYGLGEHYNSLRPRSLTQQLKALIS